MNKKLVEFIRTQTLLGKTPKEISDILITQGGWTQEEIQSAFTEARAGSQEHMQPIVSEPITSVGAQIQVAQSAPKNVSADAPHRKGLRMRTTILFSVAFLLLAAGLAYAYFVYLPNRNQPPLSEAISAIVSGSESISRATYAGSIHATGTFQHAREEMYLGDTLTKGSFDAQLPFIFSYIRTDSGTDWQAQISPHGTFSMPPLTITASATSSFLSASSTFYLRLDDISEIAMMPFDLSSIKGVWIRNPLSKISSSYTNSFDIEQSYASTSGAYNEAYKKVFTRAISEQVIKATDTLPGELIGGNRTYRYRFQIDMGKFSTIMAEELRAVHPNDESFAPEGIDRDLATLPPLWGDLWVDRDSLSLRRISLMYQVSTTSPSTSNATSKFAVNIRVTLERLNTAPSAITVPENSVTPEELMDAVQFNSLLAKLGDNSSSTEAIAHKLWSARKLLQETFPATTTASRLWRRYPANACTLLGTSTACRVGPASAIGNTFVLWANLPNKRILCVDSNAMVLLSKSLKTTEYRCPPAVIF